MIITNNTYRLLIIGSLLVAGIPSLAQASGFALLVNSASGQGNAYAGAAAHATDASTIFFNPAGMMRLESDSIAIAGHIILPDAAFTNDGTSSINPLLGGALLPGSDDDGGASAFVPNLYLVKTIHEQMKFGLGVQTLFGLATRYDANWVGKYHAVETDLRTINFNPSIAYQVNEQLSVGGGINMVIADIKFTNAIDFGSVCAGLGIGGCAVPLAYDDGFADLEGDNLSDPAFGFNAGLQYMIDTDTVFGVAYRSEIDLKLSGNAVFTVPSAASTDSGGIIGGVGGAVFIDTGIDAGITLPASLALSIAHKVEKVTYLADITWTGWSSFDELRIRYDNPAQADTVTPENWVDTLRYSAGFDYQYESNLVLRAGLAYDETPVPSAEFRTARTPGNDRTWLSFGLSYTIDSKSSIDLGYSHFFIDDVPINNADGTGAILSGQYEASVDILSVQWNKKF
ncbi:MAG: outer membrane protein transport protein [Proteobacteria bacterium]|nr:outer membrane protein transport protein [Pseudomonadota bacterium]